MRDPASIFTAPTLHRTLDLTQPVAASLITLLHFLDDTAAASLVTALIDALPVGSHLALTHGSLDGDDGSIRAAVASYRDGGVEMHLRSRREILALPPDRLQIVEPGLAAAHRWASHQPTPGRAPRGPDRGLRHGRPHNSPDRPDGHPSMRGRSVMNERYESAFAEEPVASVSSRFALCRGQGPTVTTEPAVRPWGLRGLEPAQPHQPLPASIFDPVRQVSVLVDDNGVPIVGDGAEAKPKPPTAPTTSRVDGEDPPSSEDWRNDYHPDYP